MVLAIYGIINSIFAGEKWTQIDFLNIHSLVIIPKSGQDKLHPTVKVEAEQFEQETCIWFPNGPITIYQYDFRKSNTVLYFIS